MFLFKQEALNQLQSWGQAAQEGHLAGEMTLAAFWCCFGQHLGCSTVRPRHSPEKEESSSCCQQLEFNQVAAVMSFLPAKWESGQQAKPISVQFVREKALEETVQKWGYCMISFILLSPDVCTFCREQQAGCKVPQSFTERRGKWRKYCNIHEVSGKIFLVSFYLRPQEFFSILKTLYLSNYTWADLALGVSTVKS